MTLTSIFKRTAVSAAVLAFSFGAAQATDLFDRDRGSMKDAPVERADRPSCSANVALTTDYVFRGESQSDEHAAIQGGFDCEYSFFYAGVWASNINFDAPAEADIELDIYGGVKHKFGQVEVDLGVIYYSYPDAKDSAAGEELDYVEFKVGLSGDVTENVSVGGTLYYSDDYFSEQGETLTYEGSISIGLGTHGHFSPTFSALVGQVDFQEPVFGGVDFAYWNAGVEIGLGEKFALDLRYWDTDVNNNPLLEERFVATLSSSW